MKDNYGEILAALAERANKRMFDMTLAMAVCLVTSLILRK